MDSGNKHIIATAPVVFYEQAIPDKLLDLMIEELPKYTKDFADANVGLENQGQLNKYVRSSKTAWIYENDWVSSIFSHYFHIANKYVWEYDLNGIQSIQITKYNENDYYTWHSDYGTASDNRYTRKLSATVLITDPSEYEGGDLEFIDYHNKVRAATRKKGTMIIFDSRIPHRVTPVTKGERISLVSWMVGPKLR